MYTEETAHTDNGQRRQRRIDWQGMKPRKRRMGTALACLHCKETERLDKLVECTYYH